jgi:deoxyribonuclease V
LSLQKSKGPKAPALFSIENAHAAQLKASERIIRQDFLPEKIQYVAGIDVSYATRLSIGVATVFDYDSLSLLESKTTHTKTRFPYIPTLLSLREIAPAVKAIKKLCLKPDVFLIDGQGIMHPYRLGLASHLGLVINRPTIGIAKGPLVGAVNEFNEENWAPIIDKKELVGAALLTKKGAKPVYVSIGHMVSLKRAIEVVKHCTPRHRIPKPIRLAHHVATQERRKYVHMEWHTLGNIVIAHAI